MGRAKPSKPQRRTSEQRIAARENRSSAVYLRRLQRQVELEKAIAKIAERSRGNE